MFVEEPHGHKYYARCMPFGNSMVTEGVTMFAHGFPVISRTPGTIVATKAMVVHPGQTSKDTGVMAVKRMVMHKCSKTSAACTKGQYVADVMKVGFCFKVPPV